MDLAIHGMMLIKKGVKARKKRLAGGGGGGGINPGATKTAVSNNNFNAGHTRSSADVTVIDMNTGAPFNDGSNTWDRLSVDDFVATDSNYHNQANQMPTNIDGVLTIPANQDYMIQIDVCIAQAASFSGQLFVDLTVAVDNNTFVSGGVMSLREIQGTSKGSGNYFASVAISSTANAGATGFIILRVLWQGGTTTNNTSVEDTSAESSDAFYLKIIRA